MLKGIVIATSVLVASLAHGADAPAAPTPFPVAHFTRYDEFGGIKLSPNGEYAAYLTGKYGRSIVAFTALKEKKPVTGFQATPGFEIYDFHWISNKRVVIEIAERQPGRLEPMRTGEMFAIDADGKAQKFIYGYRAGAKQTGTHFQAREATFATPEFISPLLNDDKKFLIAEHPWKENGGYWRYDQDAKPLITILDSVTGTKRIVDYAPLADASVLTDSNDQVRLAIGLNAQAKLAATWKPDPKGKWAEFELPGFDSETLIPVHFGDDQSVYFLGIRDGESFTALYKLSLADRQVTKVSQLPDAEVQDVIMDLSGKRVVGVTSYADKPVVQWLDPKDPAARIYAALSEAFPGQSIQTVTATKDGRLAVVFVQSDVDPGAYYLFDTQTMKADFLRATQPWIDITTMRPKEPFSMKARDGLLLHGYLTKPLGNGPYPMVVLPHGGPHGVRDEWEFDSEVQLLANRGYAVLQLNFRGSSGYGEDFEKAGYREWGAKMQDDVTDATKWAIDNKHADANRICIYGASYGGYAALMGAVREPTLYKCAIGYAGIYDLELTYTSADIPRSKSGRDYLKLALGEDKESLHARSPVYNADKIQVPVLLIHGKADWRAAYEQATRMKSALEKSKKPYEWMALSREGHGVYDEESRQEVSARILAFLDKYLKGESAKTANSSAPPR